MIRVEDVPSLDTPIEELAQWYLTVGKPFERASAKVRAALTAHMIENGNLPGMTLEFTYDWAPDAGAEFPHLVRKLTATISHTDPAVMGRIVELVTEQTPDATITTETKIDGVKANSVILRGGADADRLRSLRSAKPRLVVK